MEKKERKLKNKINAAGGIREDYSKLGETFTSQWRFSYFHNEKMWGASQYNEEFGDTLREKGYFEKRVFGVDNYYLSQVQGDGMISLNIYKIEDSNLIEEVVCIGKNSLDREDKYEVTLALQTIGGDSVEGQHNRLKNSLDEIIRREDYGPLENTNCHWRVFGI
ncbi:MAG: hypothetical protein PF542_00885 [Nanoarchaeota archaeon]|nr:hypothetical protein [Nanoarchaeota archaeon]